MFCFRITYPFPWQYTRNWAITIKRMDLNTMICFFKPKHFYKIGMYVHHTVVFSKVKHYKSPSAVNSKQALTVYFLFSSVHLLESTNNPSLFVKKVQTLRSDFFSFQNNNAIMHNVILVTFTCICMHGCQVQHNSGIAAEFGPFFRSVALTTLFPLYSLPTPPFFLRNLFPLK